MLFDTAWENSSDKMPKAIQERIYQDLDHKLNGKEKQARKVSMWPRFSFKTGYKIAVACIILILCLVNYRMNHRQTLFSAQHFTVSAEKGQRAFITLPDSTKVWLNSDTKINYSAGYGIKDRYVVLIGEAYFEVAKNPDKRFIVEANGMQVEALGTAFNINAYPENQKMIASLFEGSIRVSYENNTAILKPQESVKIDVTDKRFMHYHEERIREIALWRQNEIVFNGESLEEISHIMNRLYNITICIEDESLKKECYIGTIRNNSLENFIDIINLTTPIIYEYRSDTVFLKRKDP